MPQDKFDPKTAIYTPSQVSAYGIRAIEDVRKHQGRGIVVDFLSPYFAPIMPGQLCAVIAQTSNYKSGLLHYIEHMAARQLMNENRDNEIIVHVSVEEEVEAQAFLEFARQSGEDAGKMSIGQVQDWDKLNQAALVVGTVPIYRIGHSLARAEDMPNLYLSNMILAIKHLVDEHLDFKPKIAGLFFDYLQAFPIDPSIRKTGVEGQRRLQVRSDIYRLRQAAAYFSCPVVVAVQAKQHLDGANPPIMLPGVYDGEESSSIAQRCDRVISLWMPKQTHQVGSMVEFGVGKSFVVEEDMLWAKVCKQRGGLPSGKTWICKVDFTRNMIDPISLKQLNEDQQHS